MTAYSVFPVAVPAIRSYPPDGPLADALEERVRRSLPVVDGLEQAQSQVERMGVYRKVIQKQLEEFVALYGDPFGQDVASVPPRDQILPAPSKVGNCVVDTGL